MSVSTPKAASAPAEKHSSIRNSRAHDLLLGTLPLLFAANLFLWSVFFPEARRGHADFRQLYIAGYMVRTGQSHQLYDHGVQHRLEDELVSREKLSLPFNHLSFEALLFVPLSLLPYRWAYTASILVNLALLLISYRLLSPYLVNLRQKWRWFPLCLFLAFLPGQIALMQGQDSILLLLILAAAYVLLSKERDLAAGVVAGLGLFKFQLALPFAAIYLLRRQWKFCAGFAGSASVAASVSTALVGVEQMSHYVRSLGSMSVGLTSSAEQFRYGIFPGHMANVRGLIYGIAAGHWPNEYLQVVTLALSAIVFGLVVLSLRKEVRPPATALPAIIVAVLVSYHVLTHDLSVLLIPLALTLERATSNDLGARKLLMWSAVALYLAPLCLLLAPRHFYLVALPAGLFLAALLRQEERNRSQQTAAG